MGEQKDGKPTAVQMQYTYVTAWRVIGGIDLPKDGTPQELHRSQTCRFVLTTNTDGDLFEVDRGSAVGTMVLKALFHAKTGELSAALNATIEEIRAARRAKYATPTVLITQGFGEAEARIGKSAERDGFVVTFDAVDKAAIRKAHQAEIEGIKLALAFESELPSRFEKLAEGIYLKDAEGRTVYSLTFSMSARGYGSASFTEDARARVAARFAAVQADAQLASVKRLYAQMAEYDEDPLKAFLFGWSALEIFIAKGFSQYEEHFLSPLLHGTHAHLRERFLARVREVMRDKYRLSEKFACVAAVLFAGVSPTSVEEDAALFRRLKDLRDRLLHGDPVPESSLPVHELSALLRKYIIAYLALDANVHAGA